MSLFSLRFSSILIYFVGMIGTISIASESKSVGWTDVRAKIDWRVVPTFDSIDQSIAKCAALGDGWSVPHPIADLGFCIPKKPGDNNCGDQAFISRYVDYTLLLSPIGAALKTISREDKIEFWASTKFLLDSTHGAPYEAAFIAVKINDDRTGLQIGLASVREAVTLCRKRL